MTKTSTIGKKRRVLTAAQKEKNRAREKAWRAAHPNYNKAWHAAHPDYNKAYFKNNKESKKERRKKNRDKRNAQRKERYANDTNFRLRQICSRRIRDAMKKDGKKTIEFLGCTIVDLRSHLESQFTTGMTWENQGTWHIDHRRPCASFDFTDPEQLRMCWHWSNLQPLWGAENMSKGATYDPATFTHEWNGGRWIEISIGH